MSARAQAIFIAGAIVDYIASREVRHADRAEATRRAYDHLVDTITTALRELSAVADER